MSKIRNAVLACACASLSSLAAAQVYKWVDERGVTHYGQRPPGAQSGTRMQSAPPPAPPTARTPASAAAPVPAAAPATAAPAAPQSNAAKFASCRSRACSSVRRVDPGCKSSLCTEALALPDECSTISCQGRRSELDKLVAAQLRAGQAQSSSPVKAGGQDPIAARRADSAAQANARAIARCKASRGINCDDPRVAARWAREDQPITREEQQAAIRERKMRESR